MQYRQEMGWPPGRTPVHQSPAAGGAAPAGGAATSPVAHCTLATPEQQVDGAASAVPQHPQAAAEAAAPAPDEAGSSRASSPDSSADVVPRKRRRGSENDLDYLDSSEEDVLGARAAAAPVQSHVAKKHRGSTSEAMRPPHRAANRLAGPGRGLGRGKSHAAKVKVKEDLRVQAVLGRSLDPVPLFDDSRQVRTLVWHSWRQPLRAAVSLRGCLRSRGPWARRLSSLCPWMPCAWGAPTGAG